MRSKQFSQLALFALLISLFAATTPAQAPLEPPQMPARTLFYVIWRGTPTGGDTRTNELLRLWDDPGFAPVRSGIAEYILGNANKDKSKPQLTREDLDQLSSLLDNPMVLGYISAPEHHAAANSSGAPAAKRPWNGIFFVYDRTGKEALVARTVLRLRAQEKDPPQISTISIGGISALKVERKSGTTYWAETGKFAISANERAVFEDILGRVTGSKNSAGASLAQSAAYQEAKPLLGSGVFEVFLRIPDLQKIAKDSGASTEKLKPALDSLKIDSIHSFALHITLEGEKTRWQGAILGDAAPGTLFDLWDDGQQSPPLLTLVSSDTIYYSGSRVNLSAIYEFLKRAARAMLPEKQQGAVEMVEGMAHMKLGMPLPDAIALPTGDFASVQSSSAFDPEQQIYALGIQKKPEVLKLIRTLLAERVSSERTEGDATYLKISLNAAQQNKGVAQWNFYNLAVTPDVVLGARRSETLHRVLARRPQAGGKPSGSVPQPFLDARAQFPEKLNSFTYFDMQKLDWQALKEKWLKEDRASLEKQKAANGNGDGQAAEKIPVWLENADPAVFQRHLHSATGASWKDAHGIHFEEWIK